MPTNCNLSSEMTPQQLNNPNDIITVLRERCNAGRNHHVWHQQFAMRKQATNLKSEEATSIQLTRKSNNKKGKLKDQNARGDNASAAESKAKDKPGQMQKQPQNSTSSGCWNCASNRPTTASPSVLQPERSAADVESKATLRQYARRVLSQKGTGSTESVPAKHERSNGSGPAR